MTLQAFLDEAVVLEETLAACYGEMSRMSEGEKLIDGFRKLQGEEENHARVLKTGKDFARKAPDLFGTVTMNEDDLQTGLKAVRELLAGLREGRLGFWVALNRLRDLEAHYERVHLTAIVAVKEASLADLFRQLSRDDRRHALAIGEMLESLR